MIEFTTKTESETIAIGRQLSEIIKSTDEFFQHGVVVNLKGDLGTGKTVFVRGLATGLGIHHKITSPTFMIMKEYTVGDIKLCHLDLYRIATLAAAETLGLNELGGCNTLIAIEWPEQVDLALPYPSIDIEINSVSENSRRIQLVAGKTTVSSKLFQLIQAELII